MGFCHCRWIRVLIGTVHLWRVGVFAAIVLVVVRGLSAADQPDPQVVPGQTVTLHFERLGKTNHGHTTKAELYIPTDYDPQRAFPLLVWFGSGVGSHTVSLAKDITDGAGFVCVAVPYRKHGVVGGKKVNGGWKTDWPYYRAILDQVERRVGNIDPKRRVAGGYSSGAYAITYHIGRTAGFRDYFSAFIPGGGGTDRGGMKHIAGKRMLLFVGDQDKRVGDVRHLYKTAKKHGVVAELMEFEGLGHELPGDSFLAVRPWLKRNVLYPDLEAQSKKLKSLLRSGDWEPALASIRQIQDRVDPTMPEYKQANSALIAVQRAAAVAEKNLLASKPSPQQLKRFVDQWALCECTTKAHQAYDRLGQERVARTKGLGDRAAVAQLRLVLKQWVGYRAHDQALVALDVYADKQLATVMGVENQRMRAKQLKAFIRRWAGTASVATALDERTRIARGLIEQARQITNPTQRRKQLNGIARQFADTSAAGQAVDKIQDE